MKDREERSALVAALDDIPHTNLVPKKYLSGGSVTAQIAFGRDSSIMIAKREPQYHSRPHSHNSEQLNLVLEGELFVFIEDHGFSVKKGDVFRVPRNAVHWSRVRGTEPCVLLETHTPPLIGDPGVMDTAVGLIEEEESRAGIIAVPSEWPTAFDQEAVERKLMGQLQNVTADT